MPAGAGRSRLLPSLGNGRRTAMPVADKPAPTEFDEELTRLLAEEVEHTEDLEERTERLEMRQMLTTMFSFMAVAGVLVCAVLLILFNNGDDAGSDGSLATGEPAVTQAAPSDDAHTTAVAATQPAA